MKTTTSWIGLALVATLSLPVHGAVEEVEYIHTDALGTPIVVTDENGNVIERFEYEPYGLQISGSVEDGPGYTGHVEDAATGLTYMQQRYYDPQIGMFLSVDPVAAYGNPVGQFNRYWYANGSPYRYTDPDGRTTVIAGAGLGCALTGPGCPIGAVVGGVVGALAGVGIYCGGMYLYDNIQRADSAEGVVDGLSGGKRPAEGSEGKKGVLIGDGGSKQAEDDFDNINGDEIETGKDGVRVKKLEGGGRVEIHDSTGKNPNVEKGTRTIKIQDENGKVIKTIRYPEPNQEVG